MLVNRKIQNDIYEQQEVPLAKKPVPKLDIALRAKCLVTVTLLIAIAVVATMRSEAIVRNGYNLVQMKSQMLILQKENELLKVDIAKLKSPQRIQGIAMTELGMVMPQGVYCSTQSGQAPQSVNEKEKGVVSQANTLKLSKGL